MYCQIGVTSDYYTINVDWSDVNSNSFRVMAFRKERSGKMVLKSRDFIRYLDRVDRDMQILKAYYEIGGPESPTDANETVTLLENLSREELVSKIHNTRDEVINGIDRCDSLDIAHTTRNWASELLKIDLFHPKATKDIQELRSRVDKLEKDLPVTFSLYHPGTISTLLFIPVKLRDLEKLCTVYQDKFSSKERGE